VRDEKKLQAKLNVAVLDNNFSKGLQKKRSIPMEDKLSY